MLNFGRGFSLGVQLETSIGQKEGRMRFQKIDLNEEAAVVIISEWVRFVPITTDEMIPIAILSD